MQRALDVTGGPLQPAADVEDRDRLIAPGGGQRLEVGDGIGPQVRRLVAPLVRRSGHARDPVDADPGQVALGVGDLAGALADQRQPGARGQQPAEVGHQVVAVLEAERPGQVPGRERPPTAQVHDPLALGHPPPDLRDPGQGGRDQVGSGRAGRVGRSHLGVVGRVVVQAGQHPRHVRVGVERERGVVAPLLADRGAVRAGRGGAGRAEAAEPVGGIDHGLGGQFRRQSPERPALRRRENGRVLGAEQVGPPGRPVQQRAAGEHRDHLARGRVLKRVSQMCERVPGGGEHPDPHRPPDRHHVAVDDRGPVERHRVGCVHVIGRAGGAGQGQAAGDVVVVDVGLEHVGHRDPAVGGQGEYPVDVALRVDHERGRAVGDQIAPVAQRRRLDRHDVGH